VRIYEYEAAANPDITPIPVRFHSHELHESGPTRVIPFDLSAELKTKYPATSPNLLSAFVRICPGESVSTTAVATSQAFYVIRGSGESMSSEHGKLEWSKGDLFVFPDTKECVKHTATADTAIYWVSDEPLMNYLGVAPREQKFKPTLFKNERMLAEVEQVLHAPGAEHRNRMGILLGNKSTEDEGKTLTHTLWSLLNVLPAQNEQRPHRHNSVALDLAVSATPGGVYTLMGPELNDAGWVKDPVRCDWVAGTVFTTPPGWWHSHHNETDEPAWVLPMQDAGLYTHMRTLNIEFSRGPKVRRVGSSQDVTNHLPLVPPAVVPPTEVQADAEASTGRT
jgi:gentisate 1,2-dioxygenase